MFRVLQNLLYKKKEQDPTVLSIVALDLAAVMIWRGAWGFMDLYVFPDHKEMSFLVSFTLGLGLFAVLKLYSNRET